jgi:hypothetical protein
VTRPGVIATRTLASAVNDSGDGAVVFSRCVDRTCGQRMVLAMFRRSGHGFDRPVVLARRTGYPAAAVALNAHGDAIVAWIQHRAEGRGNDIRVRTRRASGAWTRTHIAGPTQPVPEIAVTITGGRRGTVAWFSEAVGEGSVGGPLRILETELDSHGSAGGLHELDRGTPSGHGEADAVRGARLRSIIGPDGFPTLAWTGFVGGHYVLRAERLRRDVGTVETLSPPDADAQLMDLATDAAGDVLAVWTTVAGTAPVPAVAAVIRSSGATAFGAPQVVLAGTDVAGTAAGAIAAGGRATVAGGPEVVLNRPNPAGVVVTVLTS